ncbi:hypothetical protein AYI70_g4958 [Smittium culicis]|uniref:Uncharacterized protein n=1 Tax=Smittium culicis TaxID=133412 RepID=A0A1R1XWN2_9FUNG|nr:hypothetical protein AYI70_g4958 [Smittium culicis]
MPQSGLHNELPTAQNYTELTKKDTLPVDWMNILRSSKEEFGDQNEIVVNLPKDDFKYKYGFNNRKSDVGTTEPVDLANTCTTNNPPIDRYSLIVDEDFEKPKHC